MSSPFDVAQGDLRYPASLPSLPYLPYFTVSVGTAWTFFISSFTRATSVV